MQAARIRHGWYTCADCKEETPRKRIDVDHINPVIPVTGFDSIEGFVLRLFCDASGLQILCKKCHWRKTRLENENRGA